MSGSESGPEGQAVGGQAAERGNREGQDKSRIEPDAVGHLFGAIDIERFAGADVFRERLLGMTIELKERCSEEGGCRVCLPGEMEEGIEAERRKHGVPLSDELWNELAKISAAFGEPLRAERDQP
jgi:LDH2 family malate/lactate/ureidoglycolate dehydrogenase